MSLIINALEPVHVLNSIDQIEGQILLALDLQQVVQSGVPSVHSSAALDEVALADA
jgi:hypothetical protein